MKMEKDLPRDKLIEMAYAIKAKFPNAEIFYKMTCAECGELTTFQKPNVLFARATCCHCGKNQPVKRGALLVQFTLGFDDTEKHKVKAEDTPA